MEAAGTVTIIKRSLDENNLRYVSYIGDGDTSFFNEASNSKLYGDFEIIEREELDRCKSVYGQDLGLFEQL